MLDRNVWRSRASALAEATLTKPRLAHSREVARLASELCDRFHADEEKGYIAGMAHDLARELDLAEIVLMAEADGRPVTAWERERPLILHGRAAASILSKHTGYADEEALQAIRDHVTGRGAMGAISRIVFVADFLEPTRELVSPEFRRRSLALSLDEMVLAVLDRKIHFLRAAAREIAPDALALHEELTTHA